VLVTDDIGQTASTTYGPFGRRPRGIDIAVIDKSTKIASLFDPVDPEVDPAYRLDLPRIRPARSDC
jgi:hypothetical protein